MFRKYRDGGATTCLWQRFDTRLGGALQANLMLEAAIFAVGVGHVGGEVDGHESQRGRKREQGRA